MILVGIPRSRASTEMMLNSTGLRREVPVAYVNFPNAGTNAQRWDLYISGTEADFCFIPPDSQVVLFQKDLPAVFEKD